MNYYEHKVDWTDAKVDRFWNFKSNYKPLQEEWFTQQVGDSIISFAKKYFSSKDNLEVLDYGAGKGHLTSLLLLENISVSACDFSNENIINLNSKFSSYSNFNDGILIRKFPTLFESNLFDFVFLIEAIEHLTDDYLESTIKEIMRILKPNGKIMITTPK